MHFHEHPDEVTCQEFVELVTDYFEGALPARTQNQVEEHLVMCHFCRTYADQMRATATALRGLGNDAPAPVDEPSEAVLSALRRRREAAQ
jgi:predicted anti-sigma-YlaC factor YlaD